MKIKQQSIVTTAVRSTLFLTLCGSAIADENIESTSNGKTEVITVTANRVGQSIHDSLTSVEVISRFDIEQMQPVSTIDLLKSVVGLDFSMQGGAGQQSSIFIRGANSNHTLILVDGLRISSATLGTAEIQNISPSQIERIEIVKGPRAAIWGSDAIGGVIQIFTRQGAGNGVQLSAKVGSNNYHQLDASFGVKHGDGASSININKQSSDGFDVLPADAKDDADGYDLLTVAVSGYQQINNDLKLDWVASVNQKDVQYDTAWGGNDESESNNYAWLARGHYQTDVSFGKNVSAFSYGQSQDKTRNFERATDNSTDTIFETQRQQLSVINTTSFNPDSSLSFGTDYIVESIDTTTDFVTDERTILGVFTQLATQVDKFTSEVALRFDDVEGVDSETSYNLAAGYKVSDSTKLLVSHGTGFKAPTFNDLYYPYGGNDKLEAEYSDNTEVSIKYHANDFSAQGNVFTSTVNNLIRWVADASFNYQPENVDTVEIKGVEVSADYRGNYANHKVTLGFNEAIDQSTGLQLIRRSKEQFSYTLNTTLGKTDLYVEYVYKGKSYETVWGVDEPVVLNSYGLVNVSVNYELMENVRVNARISNLLDEEYQTALNYNTASQQWYLGVSYHH